MYNAARMSGQTLSSRKHCYFILVMSFELYLKGKGKNREYPVFVILRFIAYFLGGNWEYSELSNHS